MRKSKRERVNELDKRIKQEKSEWGWKYFQIPSPVFHQNRRGMDGVESIEQMKTCLSSTTWVLLDIFLSDTFGRFSNKIQRLLIYLNFYKKTAVSTKDETSFKHWIQLLFITKKWTVSNVVKKYLFCRTFIVEEFFVVPKTYLSIELDSPPNEYPAKIINKKPWIDELYCQRKFLWYWNIEQKHNIITVYEFRKRTSTLFGGSYL